MSNYQQQPNRPAEDTAASTQMFRAFVDDRPVQPATAPVESTSRTGVIVAGVVIALVVIVAVAYLALK